MALKGIVHNGEPVEFKDVPEEVLLPETIVQLTAGGRSEGVHSSDLNYCPFNSVRQKLFDYYYPVDQIWNLTRGNAWDTFCSTYREPGAIYHTEYSKPINGVNILGNPDKISLIRKGIRDFKAPAYMPKDISEPKEYYVWQLNTYYWLTFEELAEKYGIAIDNLALHQCFSTGYRFMRVPLLDLASIQTELARRLDRLFDISDGPLAGVKCDDKKCFGCWPRGKVIWVE